jgi:hypothetical protein
MHKNKLMDNKNEKESLDQDTSLYDSYGVATTFAATSTAPVPPNSQQVFFVGNNWDGTVTVINPAKNYQKVGVINMVPDKKQRLTEIYLNPVKLIAYSYIRNTAGEGNDQLVDDMYSTPDGKSVVASRPSYADVVSINIATGKINWRTPVEGFRADHMAVSPDGQQVAVSASSGNVVHVLDINTGKELGRLRRAINHMKISILPMELKF